MEVSSLDSHRIKPGIFQQTMFDYPRVYWFIVSTSYQQSLVEGLTIDNHSEGDLHLRGKVKNELLAATSTSTLRWLHDWFLCHFQVYFWSSSRGCVFLHCGLRLDYRTSIFKAGSMLVLEMNMDFSEYTRDLRWAFSPNVVKDQQQCPTQSLAMAFKRDSIFAKSPNRELREA